MLQTLSSLSAFDFQKLLIAVVVIGGLWTALQIWNAIHDTYNP